MEKQDEQEKFYKTCTNRRFDFQDGVICSLTNELATCAIHEKEELEWEQNAKEEQELYEARPVLSTEQKARKGKKKATVILSILIIFSALQSIAAFVFIMEYLNELTLLARIIQLILLLVLASAVCQGKNWGRVVLTIILIINILRNIYTFTKGSGTLDIWSTSLLISSLFFIYIIGFLYMDSDYYTLTKYNKTKK